MVSDYPILRLMDNLSVPAVIIDPQDGFITSNRAFARFLKQIAGRDINHLDKLLACLPEGRVKLLRKGSDWFRIVETETGETIVLQFFAKSKSIFGTTLRLLTVIEFDSHPVPKRSTLRRLFSLSAAEANICTLVSRGYSVAKIADKTGTTEHTVRAHLKHIFQKTDTRTQGALAHLVRRCSLLPCLRDATEDVSLTEVAEVQRESELIRT